MSRKDEEAAKARMDNFERAFTSGGCGCVRDCHCGRTFYTSDDGYDWEEGEYEGLQKNPNATCVSYSVGTIILEGKEYCMDCDCWHEKARKIMDWIDNHDHAIADWLTLEKARHQSNAEHSPTVK